VNIRRERAVGIEYLDAPVRSDRPIDVVVAVHEMAWGKREMPGPGTHSRPTTSPSSAVLVRTWRTA